MYNKHIKENDFKQPSEVSTFVGLSEVNCLAQELSAEIKIRDALVTLLTKKPFHKITITDITKVAEINRSTYYYHYYEIEEVLDKIIQVSVEDLIEIMLLSLESQHTFTIDQDILPSTRAMFKHIDKHKKYYTALINSDVSNRFSQAFITSIYEFNSKLSVTFEDNIEHIEINEDILNNLYAHAAFGQVKYWIDHNFEQSSDYMAKQMTNIMFTKMTSIIYPKNLELRS